MVCRTPPLNSVKGGVLVLSLLFAFIVSLSPCCVQQDGCEVVLKNGKVLKGRLLSRDAGNLVLETGDHGVVELSGIHVRSVEGPDTPEIFSARLVVPDAPAEREEPGPYLRYDRPRDGAPGSLKVAVKRFRDLEGGNDLFLVGVIHIGEAAYYERLQGILDSMDWVLFEGVGGSGEGGGAGGGEDRTATLDVIIKLQLMMKASLGLEYQKDCIDYDRNFWINADLTWDQVSAKLDEENLELIPAEKLVTPFFRTFFKFVDPKKTQLSRRESMRLRKLLAPFLENAKQLLERMNTRGMQEVVINARNIHVASETGKKLAKGSGRWIAVFYGAAHMPDLEARLTSMLRLRYAGTAWLDAWVIE